MVKADSAHALRVAIEIPAEPTLEDRLAALMLDDSRSESTQSADSLSEEVSYEHGAKTAFYCKPWRFICESGEKPKTRPPPLESAHGNTLLFEVRIP